MDSLDFGKMIGGMVANLIEWAPSIIGAIIVLIIGFWIAGWVTRIIDRTMKRSNVDKDLRPFLLSLVGVLLKVLVIITAAGVVGIEITAFAALLAAAGLALGMALQGTLGHFAAGVMVLLFKPYRVGDLVDIQGTVGRVAEIQIFNTVVNSLENKRVIIPNGLATSGIMTNLTVNGKLRVDLTVGVAYEEDFDNAKRVILKALDKVESRLPDEPTIEILKFEENNMLLAVRPFATDETYWDVHFNSYKEIKKAFDEEGIKMNYPTRRLLN